MIAVFGKNLTCFLLVVCLTFCGQQVQALNQIIVKGHKLFDLETGDEFFVKGVAYQPRRDTGFVDPLANESICGRDIPYMKELGINTIRVYEVNNTANHDTCMRLLADAGIYLLLDLPTPANSIDRSNPNYDISILDHYRKTADAFLKYDNLLGFIAGNEVSNDVTNTNASAFVKAALRDIKAYLKKKKRNGYPIPVGYASNDDPQIRMQLMHYFNCGSDDERADFYGVNLYEWCGKDATFENSGYKERREDFTGYSIPIILTEFGCNVPRPRLFTETGAIFGPQMSDVLSGGIVYEFTEEENGYGLVSIEGNKVTKLEDFYNLKEQLSKIDPKGIKITEVDENRSPSECPPITDIWESNSILPRTPSAEACSCMLKTLSCTAKNDSNATTVEAARARGETLSFICGEIDCGDISNDARSGEHGKYSGCSAHDRLSWAYNAYYHAHGEAAEACSFSGTAELVEPSLSDDRKCIEALERAEDELQDESIDEESTSNTKPLFSSPYAIFITIAVGLTFNLSFL